MTRCIICGGRDITDKQFVFSSIENIDKTYHLTTIITGGAKGADFWAHMWATHNRRDVHVYEADWENEDRAAGMIRNKRMLADSRPDLVIAFPGGRNTDNMVKISKKAGIPVIEVEEE